MEFHIIQNIDNEYPDLPGQVIKLRKDGEERLGYSSCDEYGITDFCPSPKDRGWTYLFAADEDTIWAFLGEKEQKIIDNKTYTLLKVIERT